jgi:aldehyde dehydrogenase (NAD+)
MQAALDQARREGGEVKAARAKRGRCCRRLLCRSGDRRDAGPDPVTLKETFAPILYVMRYDSFDEVIARHNEAPRGFPRRSSHSI